MNNKVILGIVLVLLIVVGGFFLLTGKSGNNQTSNTATQTKPSAAKNAVVIENFAFSPATLTVKVGDSVTWTNQDSVGHTITADDNSFDTGIIEQGKSKSNTFSKAGTYTYHCGVHPSMTGKIVVE